MATYKLIQDIEAEDHIIGNLSLRQFIYGMVAAFLYYISFFFVSKGLAFMLVFFVPPALFFTFFAFPFGKDQSTEVWALAKLRFFIKPRSRVWDQSGVKELVTITVPKRVERILTDGLSQGEVRSRLNALASTLDSRGWVVKNVGTFVDPYARQTSDRLVGVSAAPQEVPNYVVTANDDVLDATNSPVAQQFEQMISESEKEHRRQIINKMNDVALAQRLKPAEPAADYWFMNQPPASSLPGDQTMFSGGTPVRPQTNPTPTPNTTVVTEEEKAIVEKVKAQKLSGQTANNHLRTLQPLGSTPPPTPQVVAAPQTPVTPQTNPAIISTLATNNDLDVATLARQAKKEINKDDNEVVISLH